MPPRIIPIDRHGAATFETVTPRMLRPNAGTVVTMTLGGILGDAEGRPYPEDLLSVRLGTITAKSERPEGRHLFDAKRINHHLGVYQMTVHADLPPGVYQVGVTLGLKQQEGIQGPNLIYLRSKIAAVEKPGPM